MRALLLTTTAEVKTITKNISTLVEDIYKVVSEKGGWDKAANDYIKETRGSTMWSRLTPPEKEHKGGLRMSNIGKPCARQLWYSIHHHGEGEELLPSTHLKFPYGDMLENLIFVFAVAAGNPVEGHQAAFGAAGSTGPPHVLTQRDTGAHEETAP